MCEWLSCREWCDVQLLCGGRTFSAHRAVLASVSTFLRRILLSCPLEETPTFIVLPDFDLEAMSSVLYYIYNGEVIIKKQKLEVFLDIIKALQIFMDREYLAKYCNGLDLTTDLATSTYQGNVLSTANTIFSLQTETCADQHFVNIKKGIQIQDMLQRCSNNDSDLYDKLVSRQDLDGQQRPLGNLQSQCGDRQRNSFLRDLFMETYPRNGNANGRAAGVLAISNERYRGPTSVLLTNANSIYPSGDDVLSENKTVHTSQLSDTFHLWKQLHYNDTQANERNLKESSQLNLKPFLDNSIYSAIDCGDPLMNYFPPQQNTKYCLPTGMPNPLVNNCIENYYLENYNKGLNISVPTSSTLARSAILNQVLESPWCPRVPNNYKPFRRKQKITNSTKMKETETNNENDTNNNIQTSIPSRSTNISGKVPNETVVQSDTSQSIPAVVADSEYKCTICDQVFTSASSLATHSRRHASTARYTCAECAKSFSQLRNFKYHMSVHRGTREFAATCPVCGKYFNDRGYLSSHMKIHRNRKEYKCSLCPKSFNQRVAYNMHVRIHTGVKPHVCSDCGKAFSRKMLLKQHQRTHSGERPYACTHCDKRFADRSNMTLHLRLHTGVKPFSCSLCPKSFTKKHHLKSHLNFHTGAKPYSCPRCRLAFTQSSNMRTHYKKCNAPHTG